MSNEKHQPHHRPQANGPLSDLKGIAVRHLHFVETVDIPGRLSSQGCVSEEEPINRKRWRITYLPALRNFQLDFYAANQSTPEGSYFIPEVRVAWWSPAAS